MWPQERLQQYFVGDLHLAVNGSSPVDGFHEEAKKFIEFV